MCVVSFGKASNERKTTHHRPPPPHTHTQTHLDTGQQRAREQAKHRVDAEEDARQQGREEHQGARGDHLAEGGARGDGHTAVVVGEQVGVGQQQVGLGRERERESEESGGGRRGGMDVSDQSVFGHRGGGMRRGHINDAGRHGERQGTLQQAGCIRVDASPAP